MSKVIVCVPNEGWVRKEIALKFVEMGMNPHGCSIQITVPFERPIDHNRNLAIKNFLEGDGDFLLFMDSDNPPVKNPLALIEVMESEGVDIMALPTPIPWGKGGDWALGRPNMYFNCMDSTPSGENWTEHHPQKGLQEIDAAGTGCMIIRRKVLEDVRPAFIRRWTDEGLVDKGSDFYFCQRAKESGFKVCAHYDYHCSHYKEQDLLAWYKHSYLRDIQHAGKPNINTPDYWDEQWKFREERQLPFYPRIAELVKGQRVLDFGCGRGDLLSHLNGTSVGYDHSNVAMDVCHSRRLKVTGDPFGSFYDTIVCTEVLEHLDDDEGMLRKFFEHADRVIYSVPNNCMPPGVEPEHRRVYTRERIHKITPHLKDIEDYGVHLLVIAEKE